MIIFLQNKSKIKTLPRSNHGRLRPPRTGCVSRGREGNFDKPDFCFLIHVNKKWKLKFFKMEVKF